MSCDCCFLFYCSLLVESWARSMRKSRILNGYDDIMTMGSSTYLTMVM